MKDTAEKTRLDRYLLRAEIEEFIAIEADLLDSRAYRAWLDLLSDDISYRVVISSNVPSDRGREEFLDGPLDVSWMDEGKHTLTQRVAQIETGLHWAEEPVSRTTHLYTNLLVCEPSGTGPRTVTARCRFLVYRNRRDGQEDFLLGHRVDGLRDEGDSWKVTARRVYLDHTIFPGNNLTTFL